MIGVNSPKLEALRDNIIGAIEPLRKCFKSPVKFTFIARMPEFADGDVVITEDETEKVIEAIRKLQTETAAAQPANSERK